MLYVASSVVRTLTSRFISCVDELASSRMIGCSEIVAVTPNPGAAYDKGLAKDCSNVPRPRLTWAPAFSKTSGERFRSNTMTSLWEVFS